MTKLMKDEPTNTKVATFGASRIAIDAIVIPEGGRPFTKKAIESLSGSMKAIGLLTPIMVRLDETERGDGEPRPSLVAGTRRLEAAKALGWTEIDCMIVQESILEAEMRAIAENLHRRVLTKNQRDEHIRRYANLLEERERQTGQNVSIESARADGKGHRRKGLAAVIATETGLSKKTIDRALKPADDISSNRAKPRRTPSELNRERLQKAWAKADETERAWFLDWAQRNGAEDPFQGAIETVEPSSGREDLTLLATEVQNA